MMINSIPPLTGSRDSHRREPSVSKKMRKLLALVGLSCLSMAVLHNLFISGDERRKLKCSNMKDPNANFIQHASGIDTGGDGLRYLSKIGTFVDRLLETEVNDCDQAYPSGAEDTVAFAADSAVAQEEPNFDLVPGDPDQAVVSTIETDEGYLLAPETVQDKMLDETERGLISTYDSQEYDADNALERVSTDDADTIAYAVVSTGCPEWYQPSGEYITGEPDMGSDLYEASAVVKCQVCEMMEQAATARRLGKTRKLRRLDETGQASMAEMNYTMHAIVHPMATECPLQGTHGETYNRVKLLQSENYMVEILGHPITDQGLISGGNQYIKDNIPNDVGIRDSAKLQAWTLTLHPVVVLMDYDTIIQKPLDREIDLLLADETLKGFYIASAPDKDTGKAGVDTGFLIIKPSMEEFNNIVTTYINTVFDPVLGWNSQGHNGFRGDIGISGFLSWYFANNNAYTELDRCLFAHDADEGCLTTTALDEAKSLKVHNSVCGNPRHCPYDSPEWSEAKRDACASLHRKYYQYRYQFEEKYFKKQHKTNRIGLFKPKSFLGYCRGPGKQGFLSMTGGVIEKPDWQVICEPTECPEGSFMKNDCTCTAQDDPCSACPSGTFCQLSPTLTCIGCNCGFCDSGGTDCCEFNDVNNCRSGPGSNQECNRQNDFFPAFEGSGNICGGVEFSKTAIPNGCGCKPASDSPCTYNDKWGQLEDKCFICTAKDLSTGQCETCKDCLGQCANGGGGCMGTSLSTEDFMACLGGITDSECRSNCHFDCMKN